MASFLDNLRDFFGGVGEGIGQFFNDFGNAWSSSDQSDNTNTDEQIMRETENLSAMNGFAPEYIGTNVDWNTASFEDKYNSHFDDGSGKQKSLIDMQIDLTGDRGNDAPQQAANKLASPENGIIAAVPPNALRNDWKFVNSNEGIWQRLSGNTPLLQGPSEKEILNNQTYTDEGYPVQLTSSGSSASPTQYIANKAGKFNANKYSKYVNGIYEDLGKEDMDVDDVVNVFNKYADDKISNNYLINGRPLNDYLKSWGKLYRKYMDNGQSDKADFIRNNKAYIPVKSNNIKFTETLT